MSSVGNQMIITAEAGFGVADEGENHARLLAHAARQGMPTHHIRLRVDLAAPPVRARVDHGRWIADCECGGAEMLADGQAGFLCATCLNEDAGGALRPLIWPKNRPAIEGALLRRGHARHRNWRPGETVAALRDEERHR